MLWLPNKCPILCVDATTEHWTFDHHFMLTTVLLLMVRYHYSFQYSWAIAKYSMYICMQCTKYQPWAHALCMKCQRYYERSPTIQQLSRILCIMNEQSYNIHQHAPSSLDIYCGITYANAENDPTSNMSLTKKIILRFRWWFGPPLQFNMLFVSSLSSYHENLSKIR